jgi:DNA-binding protein H-NS
MAITDPFKEMSLEQLAEAQEKLTEYLARSMQSKKREALQQIQEIVKLHSLSYEEVVSAIRTTTKRGKAVAIYRNPENIRQTWSGKGEAPNWYTNAKDKNALKIPGS